MNQLLVKYFPKLSDQQTKKILSLEGIYKEWNNKINLISRKDIDNFFIHHVLHSLSIAKLLQFKSKSHVIDVGTGGGFPGIPLSIIFPETSFTLIDSIGKKIKVVEEIIKQLELSNTVAVRVRSESFKAKFDFVLGRGVSSLPEFHKRTRHLVSAHQKNAISNGILYLKGGDISGELKSFGRMVSVIDLCNYFQESFFETKKIVHISV